MDMAGTAGVVTAVIGAATAAGCTVVLGSGTAVASLDDVTAGLAPPVATTLADECSKQSPRPPLWTNQTE